MLITNKVYSGSVNPEFKEAMRAHVLRLSLHFLVGIILGVFLLPEGAGIVLAAAAAAAGVKAFYDYLNRGLDIPACLSLMAGSLAVLLATT